MESDSNSVEIVWPPSDCSDDEYFVKEEDIDRCVTERMIKNQFHDPLASSESEQEAKPDYIDWDKIFKKRIMPLRKKIYVPCRRPPPRYPKLSELTSKQHYQFLKIISAEYPNVLGDVSLGKPTNQDVQAFEAAKQVYLREQVRYQKWAKALWVRSHCKRALRPKPQVESVYEAEFKMKAQRMSAFPKHYNVAAHIPLQNPMNNCDAVLKQDLISVTLAEMPNVVIPYNIEKPLFIIKQYMVPEPCPKHPYQTVLPNEQALSMLPITEIHRVLAKFALNNDTTYIASENALKCFTQWNRHWLIPLSVCETLGPDGNKVNVMVLDSEFSVHKEPAPMRTYKAFRHLLEHSMIPWLEREKIWQLRASRASRAQKDEEEILAHASPELYVSAKPATQPIVQDLDESSDEDGNHLFIETGEEIELPKLDLAPPKPVNLSEFIEEFDSPEVSCSEPTALPVTDIGVYRCTCEDTMFEKPPPRSFRKWSFEKEDTNEKLDIIIHCPHKAKSTFQERRRDDQDQAAPSTSTASMSTASTSTASTSSASTSSASTSTASTSTASTSTAFASTASTSTASTSTAFTSTASTSTASTSTASVSFKVEDKPGELIMEPLPEYQLDLGASAPAPDAVRSVALSLALRENASVLNVRVDGSTGEVATVDKLTSEAFAQKHPGVKRQVISTIHTVLSQLQELRPGHYLLQHEPSHGSNAMLMRPSSPTEESTLVLNFAADNMIKTDEAQLTKLSPTITTALLPVHKQRRMLPCAFTPHASMVAKPLKKPPPKKKAPPQALKLRAEQEDNQSRQKVSNELNNVPTRRKVWKYGA